MNNKTNNKEKMTFLDKLRKPRKGGVNYLVIVGIVGAIAIIMAFTQIGKIQNMLNKNDDELAVKAPIMQSEQKRAPQLSNGEIADLNDLVSRRVEFDEVLPAPDALSDQENFLSGVQIESQNKGASDVMLYFVSEEDNVAAGDYDDLVNDVRDVYIDALKGLGGTNVGDKTDGAGVVDEPSEASVRLEDVR